MLLYKKYLSLPYDMSGLEIMLLAVALAMDCLSVSIVCGVISGRWMGASMIRMAILFGLFQALMPLIGWLATTRFSVYLESIDHWIAFAMLAFIGGRMIKDSFSPKKEGRGGLDPDNIKTQIMLAVATSIDALAVGISFACLGYVGIRAMAWPLSAIGMVSLLFAVAGCLLGIRFGKPISKRLKPELFGGTVLLIIGFKILLSHTLFAE